MSLGAKIWDRFLDRLLMEVTGHDFDPRPVCAGGGLCRNCGVCCLDVADEAMATQGNPARCPGEVKPDAAVLRQAPEVTDAVSE